MIMILRNNQLSILSIIITTAMSAMAEFDSLVGHQVFSPLRGKAGPPQSHVEFGTAVALSEDGHRMAVGAPGFDYKFDIADIADDDNDQIVDLADAIPNPAGGAVFLYERKNWAEANQTNEEWTLLWALFGDENEDLGRYISLSPDGRAIAIRRGRVHSRDVEVYLYSESLETAVPFGGIPVAVSGQDCPGSAVQLTANDYLVTGCEMFRKGTGKVQVYKLRFDGVATSYWDQVLSLEGDEEGDRFGWQATLDPTARGPDQKFLFRLAVSAPNHSDKTGLVRVYEYNANAQRAEKILADITGETAGELFGFSLAMSRTVNPYLAVGAPRSSGDGNDRGSLHIWAYRPGIGQVPTEWRHAGSFSGVTDGDRLGRSVAITPAAERVAVSTTLYGNSTGLVQVFERTSVLNFELVSQVTGEEAKDRWGNHVALSKTGSLLLSGSIRNQNKNRASVGSVRVLLDRSPFCSKPLLPGENIFTERKICRDGLNLARDAATCSRLESFVDGEFRPCIWEASSSPSTDTPTSMPTQMVTLEATVAPSQFVQVKGGVVDDDQDQSISNSNPAPPLTLEGCPCNVAGHCVEGALLEKGVDLYLCVTTNRTDVEFTDVTKFSLEQGDNRVVILDYSEDLRLAGVTTRCRGDSCILTTPVDTSFFDQQEQQGKSDHLVATGSVDILVGSNWRRLIRGNSTKIADEAVASEGNFTVWVPLAGTAELNVKENQAKMTQIFWALVAVMAVTMFGCCYWAFARKKKYGDDFGQANDKSDTNSEVDSSSDDDDDYLSDDSRHASNGSPYDDNCAFDDSFSLFDNSDNFSQY